MYSAAPPMLTTCMNVCSYRVYTLDRVYTLVRVYTVHTMLTTCINVFTPRCSQIFHTKMNP